jgi:hypothetical protein
MLGWPAKAERGPNYASADYGSASIEFAVSASVLFMTMIGLMKMCLAIYTYHYVAEAAREGTRYAMVRGSSTSPAATSTDIQTYVQNLAYPGISASAMTVTPSWIAFPAGRVCTPSTNPCNNPGDVVKVVVSYAFPLAIPFRASNTYTMTSTSEMVISQ